MACVKKLLEKAKNSKTSFRFSDAVKIANHYGWEKIRQTGSHQRFRNKEIQNVNFHVLTLTDVSGEIPFYQLRNLLCAIELLEIENNGEQ